MKILHINERFHPDMGYQDNYFAEFHDPKIDFHMAASDSFSLWKVKDPSFIINQRDKEFENKYDIKIHRLKASFQPKGKLWLWMEGLFEMIDEIKPDIIFAHGFENLTTIRILLSKVPEKYLCVSDTHTLFNQKNTSITGKLYDFFFKHIYVPAVNRKNILVFYTAEENGLILKEHYKIKNENIESCLIGTNPDDYKFSAEARDSLRGQIGIGQNEDVLIYAGKFNYFKQPHLILKALKTIENQINKPLHAVFIGAKDEDYFKKEFNVTFANDLINIHLFDSVSNKELYRYYSMADFIVFPKENSISSLDAQACRLPVIMEEDMTNVERLQKGGLVYKQDDIPDLGRKILLLLNDKSHRDKLSAEGHEFILGNYDFKTIIKNMEDTLFARFEKFKRK